VTGPGATTNTASVLHADQFDPNPADNSAGVTVTPPQADLAVAKVVDNPTPNVGDTVTFVVDLSNQGPDPATNVQVTDRLPAGLSLITATPSQGAYDGTSGLWTVGQVDTPSTVTLTLLARVVSPNPTTNLATVTHSDQFDPVPGNNSASATETPQQADLHLSKSVSNPTPNVGDVLTFSVVLTNSGPDSATGVQVTEQLPAGLAFLSATPSQGSYDPASGVWTVGTVDTAAARTLTLTARVVSPDAQTNTVTVTHVDQFDPDLARNTPIATTTPQRADLQLTKVADQAQVMFGENFTFTLSVHNSGPDSATNVFVMDPLPSGLRFVSATMPSQGTFDPATGMWFVGTLANGGGAILQFTAQVVVVGSVSNAAQAGAAQFDPDLSDNTATAVVVGAAPPLSKRLLLASANPLPGALGVPAAATVALPGPDAVRRDTAFVNTVYRDLVQRDPDAAGLAYWTGLLLAGKASRADVAQRVWESPEHRGLEVNQFYLTYLHRPVDPVGGGWWLKNLLAGMSEAGVIAGLLSSAEYQAAHASDAAFLAGLYADVLGRAADPAGSDYWLKVLQGGGSRGQVIAGFLASREALMRVVDGDYATLLYRTADPVGEMVFLNELVNGGPRQAEAVAVAILGSGEFFGDAGGV
jgi:uncharacterized repeat protein (TIGR01451 family)